MNSEEHTLSLVLKLDNLVILVRALILTLRLLTIELLPLNMLVLNPRS